MFEIREDDLSDPRALQLLTLHHEGMAAVSPPESVFALDVSGLQTSEVTVWTAWQNRQIAAMGALKMLPDGTAEVKSMRTHPAFIRKGAARAILETIITTACSRGVRRISLETGSGPAFEPALKLYRARGFISGPAFGDYSPSDFNQFLHLDLEQNLSNSS